MVILCLCNAKGMVINMEIRQQLLTENDCYKEGRWIEPVGIMLHSTGANNPNLRRYLPGDELIGYNTNGNHWNMPGLDVCVHGFIGRDLNGGVQVYQTLPWNMRGWHAGGAANDTHISLEICEDDLTDSDYFGSIYKAASELCTQLCREYGIKTENVICHSEGAEQGIASNHADVMHWFPKFGVTMDDFRGEVYSMLIEEGDNSTDNETGNVPSEWAAEACEWAVQRGLFFGDGNGDMHWQDNMTREQLAVVLKRALNG